MLFEEDAPCPSQPVLSATCAPSEMTKLLEDPLKPTWRSPLPFRAEPAPVTTTELFEESALKLEYDLYYIQNLSPRLDLIVLAKTVAVALCGDARGRSERSLRNGIPIQSETL